MLKGALAFIGAENKKEAAAPFGTAALFYATACET
jgi:hypothetical protein